MTLELIPDAETGHVRPRRSAPVGSFAFVLHAHLPWVLTHGRWPHGAEWLYEAAAASYLPLIERLAPNGTLPNGTLPNGTRPGARSRLTLSLSPVLLEQLADPEFASGFEAWLEARIASAVEDRREFRRLRDGACAALAHRWEQFYVATRDRFRDRWGRSLVAGFRALATGGRVELITTAATHGYLPLLAHDASIRAQIRLAQEVFTRHIGKSPRGFWLPECAYRPRAHWATPAGQVPGGREPSAGPDDGVSRLRPGIEEFLADAGLRFFVVDAHLAGHGPRPASVSSADLLAPPRLATLRAAWDESYAVPELGRAAPAYRPVRVPTLRAPGASPPLETPPPAAFLRDADTALRVWSRHAGYPGDPDYLDFHRRRFPGGLRYWRVTDHRSDRAAKELYDPERAATRVREHAADFVNVVAGRLADYRATGHRPGFLCAPFDAELFGHWWSEGPDWLAAVLEGFERDGRVTTATPADYLAGDGVVARARLREGSWGHGGDHGVWLNDETAWAWERIHAAEARLSERVRRLVADRRPFTRALLRQLARELLLLQGSDWPFLISTLGARDYAEDRVRGHAAAFDALDAVAARLSAGDSPTEADRAELRRLETLDRPFPEVDPEWWLPVDDSASGGGPRTTVRGDVG